MIIIMMIFCKRPAINDSMLMRAPSLSDPCELGSAPPPPPSAGRLSAQLIHDIYMRRRALLIVAAARNVMFGCVRASERALQIILCFLIGVVVHRNALFRLPLGLARLSSGQARETAELFCAPTRPDSSNRAS